MLLNKIRSMTCLAVLVSIAMWCAACDAGDAKVLQNNFSRSQLFDGVSQAGAYFEAARNVIPVMSETAQERTAQRAEQGPTPLMVAGGPEAVTDTISSCEIGAQQGDVTKQFLLGNAYFNGMGVAQDQARALYWYLKAARQGHAESQHNIGDAYLNGTGVRKDPASAVRWFAAAAASGLPKSQFNLGVMHATGRGVDINFVEAVFWFVIAEANGDPKARRNREIAEKKLSLNQIDDAKARASVWLSSPIRPPGTPAE